LAQRVAAKEENDKRIGFCMFAIKRERMLKILHVSALPVWSMDGKGGMPSLRETLKGHIAAKHEIELVLPQYDPFSDDDKFLFVPENQGFKCHFARCRWLPLFKRTRLRAKGFGNGKAVPYPLRWILNLIMLLGLTISLTQQALKVKRSGFEPDLVYAHNQYASAAGFLLSRMWKIPNVTRLYGTFLADLMKKPLVSLRYPTAAARYLVPSNLLICGNDGTRGDEVARRFRNVKFPAIPQQTRGTIHAGMIKYWLFRIAIFVAVFKLVNSTKFGD